MKASRHEVQEVLQRIKLFNILAKRSPNDQAKLKELEDSLKKILCVVKKEQRNG